MVWTPAKGDSVELSEIDVVSGEVYLEDVPYDQLKLLRERAPVFRHVVPDADLVDEVWVVSRYEDVVRVSHDTDTFSSGANGINLRKVHSGQGQRIGGGVFISLDDPEHWRLRNLVARGFTPKVVRTFEQHYRELVRSVVGKALADGSFDFVTAVSAELPLLAICDLLGVPEADRWQIFRWSNAIIATDDPEYGGSPDVAAQAVTELGSYAIALADERRADPRDDILSALATATSDDRLSGPELEGFVLLLLVAGNETTRNNISHGLVALLDHPDQLGALRADPEGLLDSAVEEMTRWASPVNYMARTVMRDTVLGGQQLREGDRVAMMYASANRDGAAFPDADRFDVARRPNRHLAFGVGKHFCLGASLARVETKVVFAELLPVLDDLRLAGPIERLRSSFIHGIKHLPVEVADR